MLNVTVGSRPAGATSDARTTALAMGCAVLFLLPFAGFGVFAAGMVAQRAAAGNWRDALYSLLFAAVFGGIGFGGLVALLVGKRKLKGRKR